MTATRLKKEIDLIQAYRRALLDLLEQCKDVAVKAGLKFRLGEESAPAFGIQQTDNEPMRVALPRWIVLAGEIEVKFEPDSIHQDTTTGLHSALLWVNRFCDGGRLDSPTLWTAIEDAAQGNVRWYQGARGNISKPVGEETIRGWFVHSGPKPLF